MTEGEGLKMNLKKLRRLQEAIENAKREKDRAQGGMERILKENNVSSVEEMDKLLKRKEKIAAEAKEEMDKEEIKFYKKWEDKLGDEE